MAVSKTLFDPVLVTDVITKVKGSSALAVLSAQSPIPFNGTEQFVFTMDSDVDIVAENGRKSHGGITLTPVKMVPIKFEYGARVSDEFMFASQEARIDTLTQFNDGFAKRLAAGFDKAAMHGINPRTGSASSVVGTNHFDSQVTQKVQYAQGTPDANIEAAIALVEGSDGDCTGMVISPAMRSALAAMKDTNGNAQYPDFKFGGKPASLGAQRLAISGNVAVGGIDHGIVGDFATMFKWGYGKGITMEVIEYGDPDNSGNDLKGYNQVYIRAEAYLGWAIFGAESFARIVTPGN